MSKEIIESDFFKELAKAFAENEFVMYCETCGTIFYKGTIKRYIQTNEHGIVRDFHFLAMRHIWNNYGHFIRYRGSSNLPDLNIEVHKIKQTKSSKLQIMPMEALWTGKKIVKCSTCEKHYIGKLGWLDAAKCCLETKYYLSELP